MIDADHIRSGLWQGSYPLPDDGEALGKRFDIILFAASNDHRPHAKAFRPADCYYMALQDRDVDSAEARRIVQGALLAADALRSHERVLVTCRQGANRSGVIVAATLMLRGATAREAVAAVRRERRVPLSDPNGKWGDDWSDRRGKRRPALYNDDYENWLHDGFEDAVERFLARGERRGNWLTLPDVRDEGGGTVEVSEPK